MKFDAPGRDRLALVGALFFLITVACERKPGTGDTASTTGDIFNTFPGNGPGATTDSAYANLTMETFDQNRIQLGCMSCHNRARMAADFMWSMLDHAYPAKLAPAAIKRAE